jgi:hypothetical protein
LYDIQAIRACAYVSIKLKSLIFFEKKEEICCRACLAAIVILIFFLFTSNVYEVSFS